MIQAYEKIHLEKSNLQRDLDKMVRYTVYSTHTTFIIVWLHIVCYYTILMGLDIKLRMDGWQPILPKLVVYFSLKP